jgi:hypothetical protein
VGKEIEVKKTGRSLEECIAFARKEGPKEDRARREWLKTKHKLEINSAWWISERVDGKGAEEDSPEAYLRTDGEVRKWLRTAYQLDARRGK